MMTRLKRIITKHVSVTSGVDPAVMGNFLHAPAVHYRLNLSDKKECNINVL